ncbi:MAG: DUF1844 domain-containing protein, partial [Nitrospira sp.]|nr:DUF1844 domain-containing protein [Nitrospira sp.]
MSEQEQGFVVRDRRGIGASAGGSSTVEEKPTAPSSNPDIGTSQEAPAPPVTFSSFVISLGSSALMLMGERLDP